MMARRLVRQFPLAPEAELLVWCARTVVSDDLKARILERAQESLDWSLVLKLAEYHGVVPLLYKNLSALSSDLVPAELLTRLRQKAQVGALLNRTLAKELVALCEAFHAHGVPVIPIKGATLAVVAYGDLALRDFTDLDLLVPQAAIAESEAVLSTLGYERRSVVAGDSDSHHVGGRSQAFVKRRTLCRVDLQWVMVHRHFTFRLDRPELWARRVAVAFENQTVPGLAPEDLLIVLCVHGSKHAWEYLKWVCDVAELIRSHTGLDWNQIFARASTWRCRRMLYLGLAVAHIQLDAPLPAAVRERIEADGEVMALARRMPANFLSDAREGITEEQAGALYFCVNDSWWGRWRLGLLLCRAHSPLAMTPPSWCRGRLPLSCLARIIVPLHREIQRILSPRIREAMNRWFAFIG